MLRLTLASLALLLLGACREPAAKDTVATATVTTATPAPRASAVPATASAAVPAKGGACAALEWDKDGMNAKATTFKGKVDNGEGSDANGKTEKFQTLALEKPACGPDKASIEEVLLYTNDKAIDLKKMVGKTVTIDGEPFAAHTAHHHRPIVVEVKKLTAN